MALINCPECNKQISDTTPSCPHCGYLFSSVPQVSQKHEPSPTKVGPLTRNIGGGVALIVSGAFVVFLGIFAFFIFFILGILVLFAAFLLLAFGARMIYGTSDVTCPHCGKHSTIGPLSENFKCPQCKKMSVVSDDDEFLNPVL